ncbi:MAG: helix-turn-helix domain-containing protein [Halopseudomonas yangmingensis]
MLDIMHPGGRVMELRRQGHEIITDLIAIRDRDGRRHIKVARYVLIRLAQEMQP